MTINFGKRNAGGLTAADPGDTLYIPLTFFNDSGASISIGSSLAVTDIELFKNGSITERATDSGYAILGDTGNFDNRTGFKGISVQLFNTADDTGFYDEGSHYWVAVDSVTVDARTVRFFPAVFEIGLPAVNVDQIDGDTGAATHLAQFVDEADTGRIQAEATATLDTGAVNQAVWQADAEREITAITDTGLYNRIDRLAEDTGGVNVTQWNGSAVATPSVAGVPEVDLTHWKGTTFVVDRFERHYFGIVIGTADSGTTTTMVDASRTEADTDYWKGSIILFTNGGLQGQARLITAFDPATDTITFTPAVTTAVSTNQYIILPHAFVAELVDFSDTGVNDRLAKILADTDTGIQPATVAQIVDGIWDEADTGHGDTGSFGRLSARTAKIAADTDTGIADAVASAADTGAIAEAVWNAQKVDGRKVIEAMRLMTSVLGGKVEGAGTTTEIFSRTDTGTARVTATVDADGNRTAITYALDT